MRSSLIRSASSLSARIDSESAEIDAAPDGMRAPKVSTRYSRIARLKSCTNMRASRRKANRCMHGYNLARLYIMCTCAEDDTGDTRRHRQPQAATQTWPRMPWRAARAFDGIDACMQGPVGDADDTSGFIRAIQLLDVRTIEELIAQGASRHRTRTCAAQSRCQPSSHLPTSKNACVQV